jgi:spermidine synthase
MQIAWLLAFVIVFGCLTAWKRRTGNASYWIYYLFFFSGFPALIYQIVWERVLFAIYGINVESVAVVVTAFMLGLGLGSMAGGWISRSRRVALLACFGAAELGTASFGILSLRFFHHVAYYTAGASLLNTAILSLALLLIPTMLMGSTLPFLTAYLVDQSRNVGRSVGLLYFVNTLGSAIACFVAAEVTMRLLGQSGSIALASAINFMAGSGALALHLSRCSRHSSMEEPDRAASNPPEAGLGVRLSFPLAILIVATTGFMALAYEIVWYRLLSFESASSARVFAFLLGIYLLGIAIGGFLVHRLCSASRARPASEYLRLAAAFVVSAGCIGFFVPALVACAAQHPWTGFVLLFITVAAALLAATFPLVCHVALTADADAGSGLGFLYFGNIVGSALGSFLVGFVLMNVWGLRQLSVFLLLLGMGLGLALLALSGSGRRQLLKALTAGALAVASITFLANPLFDQLYERLLYKSAFAGQRFKYLLENRSGVIAVSQDGTVFGGGAYDGAFNIDLVHDVNSVFRPYFLSAFQPAPAEALMIGLSSGSWAQIIANHPQVRNETIVEINPGYLQLIPRYPRVASLPGNPKVRIVIDDGRRWLLANPGRRFDLILMNTTFHWREHATNLLSVEFLRLARQHLLPGGILYYNTTGSEEAQLTGVTVFPYGLRVGNFLAVSDSPLTLDAARLRKTLLEYRIDGRPVLDPSVADDARRLDEMISLTGRFVATDGEDMRVPSIESAESIRTRCRGKRIITDDNMGTEWDG